MRASVSLGSGAGLTLHFGPEDVTSGFLKRLRGSDSAAAPLRCAEDRTRLSASMERLNPDPCCRGPRASWVVWLSLVFASIAVHALLPSGAPWIVRSGSAFSAATGEVALATSRKASGTGVETSTGGRFDAIDGADGGALLPVIAAAVRPDEALSAPTISPADPHRVGDTPAGFHARAPPTA